MKRVFKRILSSNWLILACIIVLLCFAINFIATDIVMNDKIYNNYLNEKYESKYNEYKDLDIDLEEFEDELNLFEPDEDEGYGLDTFSVDLLFVLIPMSGMVIGFSSILLVFFLFDRSLSKIKFAQIAKSSLLSYLLFFVPFIISSIFFLTFKSEYNLNDIHEFENKFRFSNFFAKENTSKWLWDILSDTEIVYVIFPLSVAYLICLLNNNLSFLKIVVYSYLAYLLCFTFYHTLFWYLFELI